MKYQKFFANREALFWFLHLTGWSGYTLAAYIGALTHDKPVSYTLLIFTSAFSGMVLSLPLRYLYRFLWNRALWVQMSGAFICSMAAAMVWIFIANQIEWEMYKAWYEPQDITDYFSGGVGSAYVFLLWSGLYFGIKYYQNLQEQTKRALAANASAHEAQLKMLRYQLNPHFLFNTLNAISTLILDNKNDQANRSVTRLSRFLRYTLDNDPMKKLSLQQELDALNLYLEIEKVRFQDRLQLSYNVNTDALQALVPSLIMQPLIENAIKYAVAPREEGGKIEVSAKVIGKVMEICLRDDGPGIEKDAEKPKPSGGVGLRNTRERLQQMYGDNQYFGLRNLKPDGLEVCIQIPFEVEDS